MNETKPRHWPNQVEAWHEWRSAMTSARMHHGWILAGKKGLGKFDFALSAARELLSEEGGIAMQAHPDIISVTYSAKDDKEERKQADGKPFEISKLIRERDIGRMQRRLQTRPTLGSRRVIIIHPADDMNPHAANKLLKSLEEPPTGTFFILVTHRPARLLPTIRSRCRILRFPLLSDDQLNAMLGDLGQGGDTQAAIRAAEGSFGAAVQFAEQDLAPVAAHIDKLLSQDDHDMSGRTQLTRLIGPRPDRERLSAIFELSQAIVSERARRSVDARERAALVEVHCDLVKLAAQAPSYNFDNGLLCLEIGTLLCRAHVASDHAHG